MKKFLPLLILFLSLGMFSCRFTKHTTDVVRPRYHNTSPKNRWRVDIPLGARHIRLLERKRTKVMKMY